MTKASILMFKSVYNATSGHDKVIENITDGLNKLGYDVTIGSFLFLKDPPPNIAKIILTRLDLLRNKKLEKFDIIHIHEAFVNYNFIFTNKPVVYHYHGINGLSQIINLKFCLFFCHKKIKKIISVSKSGLKYLKPSQDIPIEVISNGVDTQLFQKNTVKQVCKGKPQLLFVGNLYSSKNVKMLINAMKVVLKEFPESHLQIVGNGETKNELDVIIENLGLRKNVELVGQLSHNELKSYYSSCDVYTSASTVEAHPLPPIEAMSLAKPLLLSNIPGHEELIDDSNAGLIFVNNNINDFSDKLQKILEKNQFYSSNALDYAKRNDWSITCKKISDVYEQIMHS
tara:strand:+ start:469 stop:1494 length:1026 start_codon:yes stop_codon:yes gene_type:complete